MVTEWGGFKKEIRAACEEFQQLGTIKLQLTRGRKNLKNKAVTWQFPYMSSDSALDHLEIVLEHLYSPVSLHRSVI